MKRLILLLILLGIPFYGVSQVGINTTSPNAQLDIKSSNQATPTNTDGILIPKIDAFPVANPTAAQQGMMVYLTTIAAGKQPGFYYWDNTTVSWIGIAGSKGWDVIGNGGTNPTTNFIGTTDDNDFAFRRNSLPAGKIGQFSTSIGVNSMTLNTAGNNTAFGNQTLPANTTGNSNTAMGTTALFSNTIGNSNLAIGYGALNHSTTASNNTAIGNNSLFVQNFSNGGAVYATNNTAVGESALFSNNPNSTTTGKDNTALGYNALYSNTTGSSNIAIGANADVPSPTANNQMSIGNVIYGADMSTTALGKIGIGVPVPTEKLEVVGKTKTTSLQVTAGATLGHVLTSDATGNATWQPLSLANAWSTTGNSSTSATTNFLGTTDNIPLNFRVNNVRTGRLESGVSGSIFFGPEAGLNNAGSTAIGLGYQSLMANQGNFNIGIGFSTLKENQYGTNNIALGYFSLLNNEYGSSNIGIGLEALYSNKCSANIAIGTRALHSNGNNFSGIAYDSNNIAIGDEALYSNENAAAYAGVNNVAVGYKSQRDNVNGSENTALGYRAMFSNKAGSKATALGAYAMSNSNDILSDFDNRSIAVGFESLMGSATPINNTGNDNVAMGFQALKLNSKGGDNIALGTQTLNSNSSAGKSIAIGSKALFTQNFANGGNTYDANNIGVGYEALYNTNSTSMAVGSENGIKNVAVGNQALRTNTIGSSNTAIGTGALKANTASGNVAVGSNALLSNDNGISNTAVGTDALRTITYGSYNTAFGNSALMKNIAYGNTALGAGSLYNNETGTSNVGVGRWSLLANISGSSNTAIGTQAMFRNETGSNNFALGGNSLLTNVDGSNNSAMGFEALYFNVSGNNNTALGAGSLKRSTGLDNVGIGMQAGSNFTSGNNNIAIGVNAMSNLTAGSGNIVIGNNATVPSATGSDQMSIANVIYGATMTSAATGKIGIGVTVPTEKLEVAGKTKTTSLQVTTGAVNGRVLTSDAAGNATWQANAGIDADFYEVGSVLPPDAITDNIYHNGNVTIGLNFNDNRYKLYGTSVQQTANGVGQATIYGYRDRDTRNDGTGYGNAQTNSAIKGYNYQGDIYTFGVSGFCYNDFTRTGGVFGANYDGTYWGSLGYKSSAGTSYGVYASAAGYSTPAAGRMAASSQQYSIGGGFYGGLIGSWSKGAVIGTVNSGSLFASYNSGDEYTSGKQIEIVDTGNSKTAAYTVTSTEIIVYKKGKVALQNGTAHVAFDADYARLLGDAPVVTTTPMGQCNGIYIESVDKTGFTIRELNNGVSNVMISWIAVGDRIDADKTASREVLKSNFDNNLNEVMFNENDLNEKAKAMWSEGDNIQFGELPERLKEDTSKKQ